MFKKSFGSYQTLNPRIPISAFVTRRKETRICSSKATEILFDKRKIGAVILDASPSGMQLSCKIKPGVGSIIHLLNPAVDGKIIWRDDKNNLIGIKFIKASPRRIECCAFCCICEFINCPM